MATLIGFRIGGTDIRDAQELLSRAGTKIGNMAKKEYAELLADKAAFLCDCVTLGMCDRPEEGEIIDDARAQLADEIAIAGRTGIRIRQNFNVYVNISPFDGYIYARVLSGNDRYIKAFTGMEQYFLTDAEAADAKNKKTETWNAVMEAAKEGVEMTVNLSPKIDENVKKLKFDGPAERAEKMARHSLLNRYLNLLSGGRQIPPVYMMEYVDRAMEMLVSPDGETELKATKMHLEQILIDLNEHPEAVFGDDAAERRAGESGIAGQADRKERAEDAADAGADAGAPEKEKKDEV